MSEKAYFAAMNSAEGFYSFYPQIFDREEIERKYLIKGGPGTGKSSFMRSLARKAEASGLSVEYYRCSSDPSSLDGVIIEGRVALLDATSPHCVDTDIAGARDEIINLGAFWSSDALRASREKIEELSRQKKRHYASAYRFLSAAGQVDWECRALCDPLINKEKMQKAAARMAARLPMGSGYEMRVRIRNALGMKGKATLDGYEAEASKIFYVSDYLKSGSLFLSALANEAVKRKNKLKVSFCPLTPEHPDALLFEECGVAFLLCERAPVGEHNINMKRFVEERGEKARKIKKKYRQNERICEGLIQAACDSLEEAGECHFELEEIYKDNMDFKALEEFTASFGEYLINSAVKK